MRFTAPLCGYFYRITRLTPSLRGIAWLGGVLASYASINDRYDAPTKIKQNTFSFNGI
jgi:hypothetical protein